MNTLFSTRWPGFLLEIIRGCSFSLLLMGGMNMASARSSESDEIERQPIYAFEFLTSKLGSGQKTSVELLCQLPSNDFQFIRAGEEFLASYELSVRLYDAFQNEVGTASIIDSIVVGSFKEIDRLHPPRLIRFTFRVSPGEYEARANVRDLETFKNVAFKAVVAAPDYSSSELALSDIQIASSVTPCADQNALVKNGYEVIPNVQRIACPKSNLVHGYMEVYNLQQLKDTARGEFTATYFITNDAGVQLKSQTFEYQKPGASAVLKLSIPVDGLVAGQYNLSIAVSDMQTGQTAQQSAKFSVVRPAFRKEPLLSQAPTSARLD